MKYNPLLTPTQYDKKLAEVYERQSRQIQTAHDQARQRDQQMVDKARAEDPVKMLEQLASTVSSVSKFAKARDAKIAKTVANELSSQDFGINEVTGKAYTDKEILEVQAKYKKQTKELLNDDIEWQKTHGKIPHAGLREILDSYTGRRAFHAKKFFAGRMAKNVPHMFVRDVLEGGDPEWQEKYLKEFPEGVPHDPMAKKRFMRDFANSRFGPEALNKGLLFENAQQDIDTWIESESVLEEHDVTKVVLAKNVKEWEDRFSVDADNKNPQVLRDTVLFEQLKLAASYENKVIEELPNGAIIDGEYIEGLSISDSNMQKAGKVISQRIKSLAIKGKFSGAQASALFEEGGLANHPAGNHMGVLIANKDEIIELAEQGDRLRLNIARLNKAAGIETKITELINNNQGDNWNKDAIQQAYDELVIAGASTKQLKQVETLLKNNQSEPEYNRLQEEWAEEIAEGLNPNKYKNIKQRIKDIPHTTFKREMEDLFKQHEEIRSETGINDSILGYINEYIKQGEKVTLLDDGTFQGEAGVIQKKLIRLTNQWQTKGINKGLTGDDLVTYVRGKLDDHWSSNLKGIYETTALGEYKAHKEYATKQFKKSQVLKAAYSNPTKAQVQNWQVKGNQMFVKHGGYENDNLRLDIISDDDYYPKEQIGMTLEQKQYTPETILKARILGLAPGTFFEIKLQTLRDSDNPDDVAYYEKLNLDNVEIPDSEAEFMKQLEAYPNVGKQYSTLIKKNGWQGLSESAKKKVIWAFVNDDWELAEYIWPGTRGGIPLRFYNQEKHDQVLARVKAEKEALEAGAEERSESEWGPDGQPSASEQIEAYEKTVPEEEKPTPTKDHPIIVGGYQELLPEQLAARIKEELSLPPEERSLPAEYYEPFE